KPSTPSFPYNKEEVVVGLGRFGGLVTDGRLAEPGPFVVHDSQRTYLGRANREGGEACLRPSAPCGHSRSSRSSGWSAPRAPRRRPRLRRAGGRRRRSRSPTSAP